MGQGIRLAGPSREVPVRLRLLLLLGDYNAQFGWLWFGVTSFMFLDPLLLDFFADPEARDYATLIITLVISGAGLVLAAAGARRGLIATRLLRRGAVAEGRMTRSAPTSQILLGSEVWEFEFEFEAGNRTHKAVVRPFENAAVMNEPAETLLYDPDDPRQALLLDGLPGRPRIDEHSVAATQARLWPRLILPAFAAAVQLFYLSVAWGRP